MTQKVQKETKELQKMLKNARLAELHVEKLEKDSEKLIRHAIEKGVSEEVSMEEVSNIINARKALDQISKGVRVFSNLSDDKTKNVKNIISEDDERKIWLYNEIGDYTQEDISKIFNTTQGTISKILKEKNKK